MINRTSTGKWFLVIAAVIVVTASVLVFIGKRQEVLNGNQQQPKRQPPRDWLTSIPPVASKVKDLEIVNARIVRLGTDAAGIAFEIRNNSPRGVMAVRVVCGNGGISKDGFEDEDNPTVIIEPYGTLTAEMNDELTPKAPIEVISATFEDGADEGDETSLKLMRKIRARERARHKAEKQGQPADRKPNQ
jgi:hypothetical protein